MGIRLLAKGGRFVGIEGLVIEIGFGGWVLL